MKTYNSGQILLVSFPFADLVGSKRRPALVLVDTGDDDVIVARVTGELTQTTHDVELADWREAGLALPSRVRLHKLATLEKRLVERPLGELTEGDMQKVRAEMANLWTGLLGSQVR